MSNKIVEINLIPVILLGAVARGSYILGSLNERQNNEYISTTNYYYSFNMGICTGAISSWIFMEGFVFAFNMYSRFYKK
ncbi:hypothetical protein CE11_00034 [Megavirus courdo11]|uniref:Uncharacterized protein n=1 Tax=Megavirus courdo11 TaxID=1128140 RepID=K7YE16_9VIRU|nr:hypothetical protein CE11_00034 [Megavirus courdo11]